MRQDCRTTLCIKQSPVSACNPENTPNTGPMAVIMPDDCHEIQTNSSNFSINLPHPGMKQSATASIR